MKAFHQREHVTRAFKITKPAAAGALVGSTMYMVHHRLLPVKFTVFNVQIPVTLATFFLLLALINFYLTTIIIKKTNFDMDLIWNLNRDLFLDYII